jgi:hypothetical protein
MVAAYGYSQLKESKRSKEQTKNKQTKTNERTIEDIRMHRIVGNP